MLNVRIIPLQLNLNGECFEHCYALVWGGTVQINTGIIIKAHAANHASTPDTRGRNANLYKLLNDALRIILCLVEMSSTPAMVSGFLKPGS